MLALPPRSSSAASGSEVVATCEHLRPVEREAVILRELLAGNVPPFLRELVFVPLGPPNAARPTGVWVTPDYLAIGADDDFVRFPMVKRTALAVAKAAHACLPTAHLVDAIYATAPCKLTSPSHGAGALMASTGLYAVHSREIDERRGAAGCVLGELVAGPKKDLVRTPRELGTPDRLAIYGWFDERGAPIQPLSLKHSDKYVDFSHGTRLVSLDMVKDGEPRNVLDVLASSTDAALLSDEGPFHPAV